MKIRFADPNFSDAVHQCRSFEQQGAVTLTRSPHSPQRRALCTRQLQSKASAQPQASLTCHKTAPFAVLILKKLNWLNMTQSSNYEHMFKIQIIIRHSKSLPLHFYLFLQKSTTTLPPSDWGLELHHFLCRDTSVQFLDLVWPGSSFTVQQTTEHQQHMYKQYTRCLPILYSI